MRHEPSLSSYLCPPQKKTHTMRCGAPGRQNFWGRPVFAFASGVLALGGGVSRALALLQAAFVGGVPCAELVAGGGALRRRLVPHRGALAAERRHIIMFFLWRTGGRAGTLRACSLLWRHIAAGQRSLPAPDARFVRRACSRRALSPREHRFSDAPETKTKGPSVWRPRDELLHVGWARRLVTVGVFPVLATDLAGLPLPVATVAAARVPDIHHRRFADRHGPDCEKRCQKLR